MDTKNEPELDVPDPSMFSADTNVAGAIKEDPWARRRRMMTTVIVFCMVLIAYCVYQDSDRKIYDTAVTMAFLLLGTTVTTFVGGAVADDKFKRNT